MKIRCKRGHLRTPDSITDKGMCKRCRTLLSRTYSVSQRKTQRRRSEEKQAWINNYLQEHPCVVCGEKDPVVLQFDHVRGRRRYDVTSMTLLSLVAIKREIRKCEVVCANDHARRTAQRANTTRWILNLFI